MNNYFSSIKEIDSDENKIDDENVSAFILNNGDIYDIKKKNEVNLDSSNTISTDEDEWGEQYSKGRVYKPTLDFKNMKIFSLDNLYHSRCISQKTIDTCSDWDIQTVDRKGVNIATEELKSSKKDNRLYTFFDQCTILENDFIELSKKLATDYDTFGMAIVEVIRNRNGEVSKFKHMEPETCRIAKNLSTIQNSDQKYVMQIVNTHERVFKIYDGKRPKELEPTTKKKMTEVLLILNYHVSGGKYGIPDWIPALKSMIGNDKVADYNISFFNNEAVPRFAVIVKGGKLDDDTKRELKSYFKKDLKGSLNAHKTLLLTTPKNVEIELLPLAVEMKDGGFRYYRKDNRDEIISAHGVPPHRIQVFDSGNSGTISPTAFFTLDKTYKYSIIEPSQKKIASMFNRVIKLDFKIIDKILKYSSLDIGEDKESAEIKKTISSAHEKYIATGVMTVDLVKQELKQIPYKDMKDISPEIKEWASTPRPIYLIKQAEKQAIQELNANPDGQNLNETPNDFGDKSKDQTDQKQTFDRKQMDMLVMKNDIELIKDKIDNSLEEINDKIDDHIKEVEK